jgi:hypothetical protein
MHNTLLKQFILPFWHICTLTKGPQALPVSGLLLALVIIINLFLDVINLSIVVDTNWVVIFMLSGSYSVVLIISLSLLMWIMKYQQRVLQTLTALFGCGVIISALALPFLLMVRTSDDGPNIFSVFILAINVWSLVVTANILRHALSVSMLLAWVLAFGYFLLGFKVTDFFIPQGIS